MSAPNARFDRSAGASSPGRPLGRSRLRLAVAIGTAVLIAGAIYLAVTRADVLLLDLAALAQCF